MTPFPVFFGTEKLNVAIFGGGENARRKTRLLVATKAKISIIADHVDDAFSEEFEERVSFSGAVEGAKALDEAGLVIIALDDENDIQNALSLAKARNLPVNVVDRPELCDFTVPSIIDRGSVVVGIATGGAAPVLARDIRQKIEALLPKRLGALADFARSFREAVKTRFSDEKDRRKFWETVLRGKVAERVLAGDETSAEMEMSTALDKGVSKEGVVHIVGAGPGDAELLTLKALRVLQDADIVFYDNLVGVDILEMIRRDADRISVGKSKGNHSVPQEEIHQLLIRAAREGKRVVRLKGGDPFIFGRGGEELEAVRAEGIEVHIIPGISASLGCAASAGIPLTHRDHAQSVTFVTGHAKQGDVPDLNWEALARAQHTLVVYMGVGMADQIAAHLIEAGRSAETPVAIIENGTRSNEIRVFGKLGGLPSLIESRGIKGPAILIIGEVAALSEEAIAEAKAQLENAA